MLHDKKAQSGQITVIKVPGLGCWRAETIPVEGLRPCWVWRSDTMKNTFGSDLSLTIFGESHGKAVGAVLDGMAAGSRWMRALWLPAWTSAAPGATAFPLPAPRGTRCSFCPA